MRLEALVANHDHVAWGLSKNKNQPPPEKAPPQEESSVTPLDTAENKAEQGGFSPKGVIRNLFNGHFKGVADVRLRIVHKGELDALETGQVKEVLTQPTEMLADLRSDLEELMALDTELPLDSELAKRIAAMAGKVAELSQKDEVKLGQAKAAIDNLRTELDNLLLAIGDYLKQSENVTALEELIEPVDPQVAAGQEESAVAAPVPEQEVIPEPDALEEPSGDGTGQVAAGADAADPNQFLAEFLAKWQRTAADEEPAIPESAPQATALTAGDRLAAELDDLLDRLDQVTVLPPLSPPPDNQGIAYYKFLSMLQNPDKDEAAGLLTSEQNPIPQIDAVV